MDLIKYLFVASVLFFIGVSGIFLNRKNIVVMLMSIELMLLSVNFNLVLFSIYLDDVGGQVYGMNKYYKVGEGCYPHSTNNSNLKK